ncbi:hypothetical protein ACFSCX_20810 [Bacillus salitolerans]|uniref:Uncharacterized protein n=1 Tax=Bacillus salitolerans TaxID=1437434 RepID=A0ABW4LX11_9BACI
MKKILVVLMCTMTLILGACSNTNDFANNDLPITHLSGSYSIDVDDLSQIVGDADYVFVAKVNSFIETIYKDTVIIETENGTKEVSSPYSKYNIEIIDNIKGNLKKNTEIEILKNGGLSQDEESIVLSENDSLFEVGNYHIMAAYAQPDGSLLVSGPNSSLVLSAESKSEIVSLEEYKNYKKAFEKGFVSDRERFKSSYEDSIY